MLYCSCSLMKLIRAGFNLISLHQFIIDRRVFSYIWMYLFLTVTFTTGADFTFFENDIYMKGCLLYVYSYNLTKFLLFCSVKSLKNNSDMVRSKNTLFPKISFVFPTIAIKPYSSTYSLFFLHTTLISGRWKSIEICENSSKMSKSSFYIF